MVNVIRFRVAKGNKIHRYGILRHNGKTLFMGGILKPKKNNNKDKRMTVE